MSQVYSKWASIVKFVAEHKDTMPIIISIISLIVTFGVALAAYYINKNLYEKSMPTLHYDSFNAISKREKVKSFNYMGKNILANFSEKQNDYDDYIKINLNLKNYGGSSVSFAVVFLKINSFSNIFTSQPIANLPKDDTAIVSFLINKNLIKTSIIDKLPMVSKLKNKKKETIKHNYYKLSAYVFFYDIISNSYYLKFKKNNLISPPNSPKKIHKYSFKLKLFKIFLTFIAKTNKTTFKDIYSDLYLKELGEEYKTQVITKKEDTE